MSTNVDSTYRNVDLKCVCGWAWSIRGLQMGERRDLRCGYVACDNAIEIWRAVGPIGQLRYRSEGISIVRAGLPYDRAGRDVKGEIRSKGDAPVGVLSSRILRDIGKIREIILAGHCELTLTSGKTGDQVTYRIVRKRGKKTDPKDKVYPFFVRAVSVNRLTTARNYLGCIWPDTGRYVAPRSGVDPAIAEHQKVFAWFFKGIGTKDQPGAWVDVHPSLEVWRGERCVRCGHALKDPLSIHNGWGPICARVAGVKMELPPSAEGALGEGAAVYRDLMLDLGVTDPSAPQVIRAALLALSEPGERGQLARMAVDYACSVLATDEKGLRKMADAEQEEAPEIEGDSGSEG